MIVQTFSGHEFRNVLLFKKKLTQIKSIDNLFLKNLKTAK